MKKGFFALIFLIFFLPSLTIAGLHDYWLECNSTIAICGKNNKTIDGTNYYCCGRKNPDDGPYNWGTANCDYCGCTRNHPTVTIEPSSKSTTSAGSTLTYIVNVTNNDNSPCGSSTFSLTVSLCPSGFTCNLASTSLTILPNCNHSSTTIGVKSSPNSAYGAYTFKVNATNNNAQTYSGEGSAQYVLGQITTTTTVPPGTPPTTIPPGTTTTTVPQICNYNQRCDWGETQDCPDCRTVVQIIPSQSYPGQTVRVIVYFNDSRFDISKNDFDAKVELWIDEQEWDPSYCPINGKKWREEMGYVRMGGGGWTCSGKRCTKIYENKEVVIVTEMGYGYIEAQCVIPPHLSAGTRKLRATPTIYSIPITLRAAEAELKIGNGLYTFVLVVKAVFSRLTGFFVFA